MSTDPCHCKHTHNTFKATLLLDTTFVGYTSGSNLCQCQGAGRTPRACHV